jgi:predicted TIM-barrel fold metal-dependent hydrolase
MSTERPRDIIDLHSHVIAPDAARYPLDPLGGKQSEWSRDRPVDADGMLAAMREAGVSQTALVQASTCYGHDNRYVADSVAAHPDRFIGVFSVDMRASDACLNLRRWLNAGLAGARVFIAGHTAADKSIRLDDPAGFAAWSLLEAHRIPVCVQIRADGLDQVRSLLERFPGVPVLLDHFARPHLEEGAPYASAAGLFALARYPNLFCKFTTHNVRESREGKSTQAAFARAVVNAFGADRLAWGSNFPASKGSLAEHVAEALECTASLSASERDWIFAGTARRLYPQLTGKAARA